MKNTVAIFKRELRGYFSTPIAPVFLIIFLMLTGLFTFKFSGFYEIGQADLRPFFFWHPWLYLLLVPAISMRLWAEERGSGTIELLLTLPVSLWEAVIGKFLAAWAFIGIGLGLTFSFIITVAYLGNPDGGVILAGFIGSFLMAGAFLALGCCVSTLTKDQVIAFILTIVGAFLFISIGFRPVLDFLSNYFPIWLLEGTAKFSFLTHFESIQRGVLDLKDIIFFLTFIGAFLYAGIVLIDNRKAM
ncbi:MAG: ABC transporter permease subunit [bacterium]